ncbi:glycosyltransferase [Paenibacillus sp. OV219]|uniref:glycosyltransferase n=1 Tax=Paenibacillus sp. OV219 TaxID=1884377 RepID=UPI0008CAACD8|nr:glycosyltransferase [Paenibacillus sp. OV219]SEO75006.1 Glycosyl transferase family 2 [Paenibacillus sp. OV219]
MGVSAAMIVKDGERCIERAIRSVLPAVHEFVIVDTGSTDRTIEIIEKLAGEDEKIKLSHYVWSNDFSAARNESLSKVSHDWVFVVDADDELPAQHQTQIRQYTEQMDLDGQQAALYIVYDNTVGGKITSSYDNAYIRIFPSQLRFKDMIHEVLDLESHSIAVRKSDIHLLHDGYDHNVVDTWEKRRRNLHLLQQNLKKDQDNARLWMQLGREMKELDPVKAKRYLEIAESKTNDPRLLKWINESRQGL